MMLGTLDIPVVGAGRIFSVGQSCGEDGVDGLEERMSECHDGTLVSAASFEGMLARLQP